MKYCSKCGAGLSDDAMFCPECGGQQNSAPVNPTPQPVQPTPVAPAPQAAQPMYTSYAPTAAPAPKKSKTPIFVIAAIALCVLALVIIIPKAIGGGGYKSAFNNLCSAINNQDMDKLLKVLPPAMEGYVESAMALGGLSEEDLMEEFTSSFGSTDIKVDYKINSATRLSTAELANYESSLGSYMLGSDSVTDGYTVNVTMSVKMYGETEEDTDDIVVLKIGGRWCFADLF